MRAARRGAFARMLSSAALIFLAGTPSGWAAGGNTGMSGFAPFSGFPAFTQHSGFVPFTAASNPDFPRSLCCVTGASAPEIELQPVATPPVPQRKPAPARQTSITTEAGVTVIRGVATH